MFVFTVNLKNGAKCMHEETLNFNTTLEVARNLENLPYSDISMLLSILCCFTCESIDNQ